MAKISRAQHKVFGASGSSDNFAKFGSEVAGTPIKTKDIATIQSLPAWNDGFQEAIYGANKALLLEDLNAWAYEHSTQVGYLFQAGVAEWDAATEYEKGSFVQRTDGGGNATGQIYKSLIDVNTGNAPPASASNGNWLWMNPPANIIGAAATLNVLPKVTDTAPANGVPGSVALSDSQVSEDGTNVIIGKPLKFPDATIQGTAAAPITVQNVVTGSRALNTVFQNTMGRPMFVAVSVYDNTVTPGCAAYTDGSNPPTTEVAYADSSNASPDYACITFIVLPGNYYKVVGGILRTWVEWS